MAYKVNDKIFKKRIKKLERFATRELPRKTLNEFKANTPIDRGNARRKTILKRKNKGFNVVGDYDYSGVLDQGLYPRNPENGTGKTIQGYSTQATQGMVKPTLKFVNQAVRDFVKRKIR